MNKYQSGAAFINSMIEEALKSAAVNHPYLTAMREGNLPDVDFSLRDFAFQYGFYSKKFTRYVSAVINNLTDTKHKEILQSNLAEEKGDTHDVILPPDVLATVEGQPHATLYRRFQEALGIDATYRSVAEPCQTSLLWSNQFLQLCEMNECVGIGAIGIGTELIVPGIYNQLLECLKSHSNLTMTERVFFDLHSQCDEEHAVQLLLITEDLAQHPANCEQIEYGAKMAINMRIAFWDKMLERARYHHDTLSPAFGRLSAIGY